MAIKEKVRKVLVNRQDKQYERRLAELTLDHDAWEKKREMTDGLAGACNVRYFGETRGTQAGISEVPEETAPAGSPSREGEADAVPEEIPEIFCVLYSDIERFIESGELLNCEDGEIVLFARKEGRLSSGAAALIYTWFIEHPTGRLVYGDEDVVLEDGGYDGPYFKPDWSPDTYASAFYIGSLFAVRGSVLKNALMHAQPEELTAAQKRARGKLLAGLPDALFLKLAIASGGFKRRHPGKQQEFPIGHIDEILFHLEEGCDLFLGRRFPRDAVLPSAQFFLPMAGWNTQAGEDLVTIIIPTKDHPDILRACLQSIRDTCDDAVPFEILIVDNGSTGYNKLLIANFITKYEHTNGLRDIRYIHKPMPFNFSRMCNLGASHAKGSLLLFLNDDITARSPGWLYEMAVLARRSHVGAVGAKLLYPEIEEIQHAGVTNVRLGPMHKLQHMTDQVSHYYGFNRGIHDLLAVTGACLMIEKTKYEEAGGLPEDMAVAFNDVDLCYTLYEAGYYNVVCNHVCLWHHESLSRGLDTLDLEKMKRLAGEHRILMGRHEELYHVDPFYSIHLNEDEHVSEIAPLYEVQEAEELPLGNLSHHAEGLAEYPVDAVVRIGVEYADSMEYWVTGKHGDAPDGYYIKGYAFVIGADNACYDRRLLLRRLKEQQAADGTAVEVPEVPVWSVPVGDWYRPDIREKLSDQTHVDLTGYRVRIGRGDLPAGIYQLGMLVIDRTSRQRLVNWVANRLTIPEGPSTQEQA